MSCCSVCVFHDMWEHCRHHFRSLRFYLFNFYYNMIPIWNSCKGRRLLILSSLSVTLLCFFTRSDLVVPTSSHLLVHLKRGDVWNTAEGGVMGGRATEQCFRSWVRSVDERQRVRKREREGVRGQERWCVVAKQRLITKSPSIMLVVPCLPSRTGSLSLSLFLSLTNIHTYTFIHKHTHTHKGFICSL